MMHSRTETTIRYRVRKMAATDPITVANSQRGMSILTKVLLLETVLVVKLWSYFSHLFYGLVSVNISTKALVIFGNLGNVSLSCSVVMSVERSHISTIYGTE